ncbi:hypothetical protein OG213_28870 [Streptomyces mirabilis]
MPLPQVVDAFAVEATFTPAGRSSAKLKSFFAASSLVFVTVMVSVEVPPLSTVAGLSALSEVFGEHRNRGLRAPGVPGACRAFTPSGMTRAWA